MTVTDGTDLRLDQDSPFTGTAPMHQQAAAELGQELTLVARAMFAQLLPDAGSYALSGLQTSASSLVAGVVPETTAAERPAPQHTTPVDMAGSEDAAKPRSVPVPPLSLEKNPVRTAEATLDEHTPAALLGVPVPADLPAAFTPEPEPAAVSASTELSTVPVPQLDVTGPAGSVPSAALPAIEPSWSLGAPVEPAPLPSLGVPASEPHVEAAGVPVPQLAPESPGRSAHRPDRSMAMLAEIGFLDE
jgi:hypothetical protein